MNRRFLPGRLVERGIGVLALVLAVLGPLIFNGYWAHTLLTQTFIMGTAAASLIFLSAYGGMVSLAQTGLYGIAGFIVGNLATKGGAGGETKGLHLGWDPTIAVVVAIVLTTGIGLVLGLVAAVSGFSGIGGINRYTPGWIGDVLEHPNHLYYAALIVAVAVYLLIRLVVRTPFGITLQGVRDEPLRMTSLGYNVPLHRALAFTFGAFIASLAGVLFVWWNGQIDPQTIGLQSTIDLLVIAVIGGLLRIEGAWLGAFAFIVINNEVRDVELPGIGGSFNTIIGLIFLAVVVVSPSGLMGIWDRITRPTLGGWDRAVREARVVEAQKAGP